MQAALRTIFTYEGFDIDTSGISFETRSVTEWLNLHLKVTALELNGATLDEVLYYVYKKYPVIVLLEDNEVRLITAYDQTTITILDPISGTTQKPETEQAEELFEASGNRFFTYID